MVTNCPYCGSPRVTSVYNYTADEETGFLCRLCGRAWPMVWARPVRIELHTYAVRMVREREEVISLESGEE